uniref:CSON007816 protein n=1 Tax=Culicoides sonorensis TaxID=179676 RepID=A0A336MX65_CULSO
MARNFNGFILAQDPKPTVLKKAQSVNKSTSNGKPKSLLQENLSLVKAETKKIYGGSSGTTTKVSNGKSTISTKKPLKATKEVKTSTFANTKPKPNFVKSKDSSSNGKSETNKPIIHLRSRSRTLEPHEIVLLKHPNNTEEPGVYVPQENYTKKDEIEPKEDSDPSYESDFEEYESDFSDESSQTNGTQESETKTTDNEEHLENEPEDDDSTEQSENFTTAIEIVKPIAASYKNSLSSQKKSSGLYERSYEIMKKITLDHMSYEIYEATPVPYQTFMKLYGNSHSMQNSTQTDTFTKSAETQTTIHKKVSVWTQFPIEISTQTDSGYDESTMISIENDSKKSEWMEKTLQTLSYHKSPVNLMDYSFDMDKLNAFLMKSLPTISSILERNTKTKSLQSTPLEISKGFKEIDINNLNRDSNVSLIYAHPEVPDTFLTVHTSKTYDNFTQECLVCIWNTAFPDPIKILSCWNWISCLLIVPTMKTVIVGGAKDGVLICWDTLERVQWNRAFPLNFHNAPSVVTTSSDSSGAPYSGEIISVRFIPSSRSENLNQTCKICTLHEEGLIIQWSLLYMQSTGNDSLIKAKLDQGAMWSKLKLIQTNSNVIITLPTFSATSSENGLKIETDLEKTFKYFEAGIYNDKVLQNISEIEKTKTKYHLMSLSERVLDFLIVNNEQFVVLTNKNYLYTCSIANEKSKLKRLNVNADNEAYGVKMCQISLGHVAVLLSNGIIKFINFNRESAQEILTQYRMDDISIFSTISLRYDTILFGCSDRQLFIKANNKLTIFNVNEATETCVTLQENVKYFQFIKGIDKDMKLAMLLQDGTVIIHFLK